MGKDRFSSQHMSQKKNATFGIKLRPKVVKSVTQKRHGFRVGFLPPFGSILAPFWNHLGTLGAPFWHQSSIIETSWCSSWASGLQTWSLGTLWASILSTFGHVLGDFRCSFDRIQCVFLRSFGSHRSQNQRPCQSEGVENLFL